MIKEKEQFLRKLLMAIDISVVFLSIVASFMLRKNIHYFYTLDLFPTQQVLGELYSLSRYIGLIPLLLFIWWITLSSLGMYESFRTRSFFEVVWCILKSTFFAMVISATVMFIFKFHFISRTFVLMTFFMTALSLIAERWIIISFFRFLRKRGYNYRNILLVGTGVRAKNFIRLVDGHNEWGLKILGLIDANKEMIGKTVCGKQVLGILKDIPDILTEKVIDEVVFIVPRKWLSMIEESLLACEIRGVKTNIAADFFNMKIAHSTHSDIGGIPIIGFKTTVGEEWQLLLKRLFDIIFALVGAIVLAPVFVMLVVVIKCISSGPAIFRQVRSGLNGRKFVMYKFRTMVDGADEKKEELLSFNEMDGPVFKMRDDPRVTRFGRFLRRTSLDELPQLFNVLRGDMSIVGPRPPIPSEVEKYEVWQRRRLSMKPGLTCLWQVNGRNNVDFDRWMNMDLEYIDNWSLAMDFKILLKTVPVVFFSIGAR